MSELISISLLFIIFILIWFSRKVSCQIWILFCRYPSLFASNASICQFGNIYLWQIVTNPAFTRFTLPLRLFENFINEHGKQKSTQNSSLSHSYIDYKVTWAAIISFNSIYILFCSNISYMNYLNAPLNSLSRLPKQENVFRPKL